MIVDRNKCFGCGACSYFCKNKAISMILDDEGFYYPKVVDALCNQCNQCDEICPANNQLNKVSDYSLYLLKSNDNQLLLKSSSGGAFSLIADYILKRDGLVCGAVFNDKLEVIHKVDRDIEKMRKSKYVQSNLSVAFVDIEDTLKKGKEILFVGTPCQCHSIKLLLDEYKDQITLVSLICRGVSSIKFWKDYLMYLENRYGKIASVDFRDKTKSKNGRHVTYKTTEGKEISSSIQEDPYMVIYNKTLSLRPSCYNCPYTNLENDFDFTIGDAWNLEGDTVIDDKGEGLSLVIARSKKANEIIKEVSNVAYIEQISSNQVKQAALKEPAKMTLLRKIFFKDVTTNEPMEVIVKKYGQGIKQ